MKKNIILLSVLFLSIVLFFSCASGTALVTGTQRAATNPEAVVVYSEPPAKYEVIGIVTASSDSGWTEQSELEYAVAELKKQAAKIGANGVILENIATSNSGGVFLENNRSSSVISTGVYIPVTAKNVSGKAIYVSSNE